MSFHNVAELHSVTDLPGLRLQRITEADRRQLSAVTQHSPLSPTHAEVRWVPLHGTDAGDGAGDRQVRITLYSAEHHEYVQIFNGDCHFGEICIHPGEARTIELPTQSATAGLLPGVRKQSRFSDMVWRLRISGTGRVHYISRAGAAVRPPHADEIPAHTLIAHGSSITMGFSAPRMADSWIQHVAQHLGWDVLNLGFGGACHVEEAMAQHLAVRTDWHVCMLELGVNLIDHRDVSTADFAHRIRRFLELVGGTGKPVLLINLFPLGPDLVATSTVATSPAGRQPEEFRVAIREVYHAMKLPNVLLLEGSNLLPVPGGLTTDLVHPSAFGHGAIGMAIAKQVPGWLESFPTW